MRGRMSATEPLNARVRRIARGACTAKTRDGHRHWRCGAKPLRAPGRCGCRGVALAGPPRMPGRRTKLIVGRPCAAFSVRCGMDAPHKVHRVARPHHTKALVLHVGTAQIRLCGKSLPHKSSLRQYAAAIFRQSHDRVLFAQVDTCLKNEQSTIVNRDAFNYHIK